MSTATLGFAIDSSAASSAAVDLEKLTASAVKTENSVESLEQAARGLGTALGAAGKGADSAKGPVDQLGKSFGSQDQHVQAFRRELERLTDKYQPLARATRQYETSVGEISRAHQLGIISAQQMQKALDSERVAYDRLKQSAQSAGNAVQAANQNQPGRTGAQNFNAANAGYQFQDIAVTAAMGMNPLMIGLQQGTQLASVVSSMERPVAGLAAAFASVISPVSLVTIGLVAGTAALIQYVSTWESSSGVINGTLAEQNELISAVAERWGEAAPALKKYADELLRTKEAEELQQAITIRSGQEYQKIQDQLATFADRYAGFTSVLTAASNATGSAVTDFSELGVAFVTLQTRIAEGKATIADFDRVRDAATKSASGDGVDEIEEFRKGIEELTGSTAKARDELLKLQRDAAIALTTKFPSQGAYDDVFRSPDGTIQGQDFPLPENGPRPGSRPLIELEGLPGDKKLDRELTKEENLYKRSIEAAKEQVEQMKLQAQTAGETGLAADAFRFKLDLLQKAFKDGKEATADQRNEIDQLAESYRGAAEAAANARFNADMGFNDRQLRRSTRDQQIAQQLKGYGFGEDLNSPQAKMLREQMDWQEAKDLAKGFGSTFSSELLSTSGDIGKSFAKALQSSLERETSKLWDKVFDGLGNMFADWMTGGSSGGGAIAAAIGGKAANSNVAGGFSGLAPVGAVTRSSLPDVVPSGEIASYIAKAAAARGIDPNVALNVAKSEGGLKSWNLQSQYVKNGVQEPSFGPFQLYKGGGLGNDFMKKTGMDPALASSGPAGVDFALDHASKNGWGAWYGADKAGISKWQGIGKNGGMDTASDAVNNLATSAGAATKGLDTLGGGLGKLGQSLSTSFFPAAPAAGGGGGGFLSMLTGAFGGGLSSAQRAKYTPLTGLFADGTNYAPGGMALVGERGAELVNLPQGAQVFNTNKTAQMLAGAANSNSTPAPAQLMVNVEGANGDNHVRKLVQQGVGEALAQHNENQRRGGFGTLQARYTAQKG